GIAGATIALHPVRPVDLTIEVVYDDPRALGRGRVTVASRYFSRGTLQGEINTSPDLADWLAGFYREFRAAQARRALPVNAPPSEAERRDHMLARLRGFGEDLYRRAAPKVLKDAFAQLLANPQVELRTIQIYSNNPLVPWELMRAPKPGGGSTDFFGIAFSL